MILALLMQAQLSSTPAASQTPALVECRFPTSIPSTASTPTDPFAIFLPDGVKAGPFFGSKVLDPANLLRNGHLSLVDMRSDSINLVGPRGVPKPFLTLMTGKPGPAGSVRAALDFLDSDFFHHLGNCIVFYGKDAESRFAQVSTAGFGAEK